MTDPGSRLPLVGRMATIKVFEGDVAGSLAFASQLLASNDETMVSRGAYVSSIALASLGRTEESVSVAYAGLQSHRRASGVHQLPESQLIGAVMGHAAAGHFAQAETDAATGRQASLAAGDKEGYTTFLFLAACVLIERGQLATASKFFLDAESINRELHDLAPMRWCFAGRALAEAMSGHLDQAMAAAAELDELPASPMRLYDTDIIDRSRAWVSVAAGSCREAARS